MTAKQKKAATALKLTKTRLTAGVWEGVLTGAGTRTPALTVSHHDLPVLGITLTQGPDKGSWFVHVPVPANQISDGIQTFVILDEATGETLSSFALLAGEGLAEDIRAEMDLLRAELDMLKRAFRRHCVETA